MSRDDELFQKKTIRGRTYQGGGDSSMFGITLEQLTEIGEARGKDLMQKLNSPTFNGVKGILEKLKVDGDKGLDSNNKQDLEQRQIAYGKNRLPLPEEPSSLLFVVAHDDWKVQREFRKVQEIRDKEYQATVIRDNRVQKILLVDLVVGDICPIETGDILRADGLVIQSNGLKVDEASYTGEPGLITKNGEEDAGLLSDTRVMEGSGRMVVIGVGMNSATGRIVTLLKAPLTDSKE